MANLKKTKEAEVEVQVQTPDETQQTSDENTTVAGDVTPEAEAKSETDTKKDEKQTKTEDVKVEVDTTPIDNSTQATEKNVRVRMREDHKCWVNNELYDMKKGQCYNVPVSVKKRLNKAGVLLPL